MSATEVVLVVGIIGFVIFRQVQGEPLRLKRVVLLPVVLTVLGFTDLHLTKGHLHPVDITCLVIGTVGSALVGFGFGGIMRLESREGYLWAQLPLWGLWLWALLIAWRVVVIVIAGALNAHIAASTSTLLFSLGVNRLGQAAVIVARAARMGIPFAPEDPGGRGGLLSGLAGGGGGAGGGFRDPSGTARYERRGGLLGDRRGRGRGGLLDGVRGGVLGDDDREREQYERERYERDRYERERYERDRYERDRYDRGRDERAGYDGGRDDRDRGRYDGRGGDDRDRGAYDRDRDDRGRDDRDRREGDGYQWGPGRGGDDRGRYGRDRSGRDRGGRDRGRGPFGDGGPFGGRGR